MKTATLVLTITLCAAGLAEAQVLRTPGASKRPRSDFGWQDGEQAANEEKRQLLETLSSLSGEHWRQAALARMAFTGGERQLSFDDVLRIGAVTADRRAVTRSVEGSPEGPPSWTVAFGRKTPRILTLTLTDSARTEVRCDIEQLLEAGEGYLGVFQAGLELLCLTRAADSG